MLFVHKGIIILSLSWSYFYYKFNWWKQLECQLSRQEKDINSFFIEKLMGFIGDNKAECLDFLIL